LKLCFLCARKAVSAHCSSLLAIVPQTMVNRECYSFAGMLDDAFKEAGHKMLTI